MKQHWPWFEHLSRAEAAAVGAIDYELRWLKVQKALALGPENSALREQLQFDIDAGRKRRERIANRGTARARLAFVRRDRSTPVRSYRRHTDQGVHA